MSTTRNYNGEFCSILDRMRSIYTGKNEDYDNAFSAQLETDGWGYYTGLMGAKLSRVRSLLRKTDRTPKQGESLNDNLIDLANYAIMTLMEVEAEQAKRALEQPQSDEQEIIIVVPHKELTDEEIDEIEESCDKT